MNNSLQTWLSAMKTITLHPRQRSRKSSLARRVGGGESLEIRSLLSGISQVVSEFNTGAQSAIDQSNMAAKAAFAQDLPMLAESAADGIGLASKLQQAFGVSLNPQATVTEVRAALTGAGFTVEWLQADASGKLIEDTNGDLIRVSRSITWQNTASTFRVSGDEVDYFNDIRGGIDGRVSMTTGPIILTATMGVDLQNGQPAFYISDDTRLEWQDLQGTGQVSGEFGKGWLLHLIADGSVNANFDGQMTVRDIDGTLDGKLHLSQSTNFASAVRGEVTGTAQLQVGLSTDIPFLTGVRGTGIWNATLDANGVVNIGSPSWGFDAGQIKQDIIGGFFGAKNGLQLPGPIGDFLRAQLPILNTSIGEQLGVDRAFGILFQNISDTTSALQKMGITLPSFDLPFFTSLINGDKVDLIKFNTEGSFLKWSEGKSFPVAAFPVGPFVVKASLSTWGQVHGEYNVGLGIDTTGVYIDPATHIGIRGAVGADVTASVSFLEIAGVNLSAGLGVVAGVGLHLVDPDPSDGNRIYFDEIFRPGEDVVSSVLSVMQVDAQLDVVGHVKGEVDLPWPLPDFTLFDETFSIGAITSTHQSPSITGTKRIYSLPGQALKAARDLQSRCSDNQRNGECRHRQS